MLCHTFCQTWTLLSVTSSVALLFLMPQVTHKCLSGDSIHSSQSFFSGLAMASYYNKSKVSGLAEST